MRLVTGALWAAIAIVLGTCASEAIPAQAAGQWPDAVTGYDISWPQCGHPYPPAAAGIAIVGVTYGSPFNHWTDAQYHHSDDCVSSEWAWARTSPNEPAVYMNLDFLHGQLSPTYPDTSHRGDTGPRGVCNGNIDCQAYNYGWNAATDAIAYATQRQIVSHVWWIDVETGNYWPCTSSVACDTTRDSEDLQGAIDALHANHLTAGVYSTPLQYGILMGGYAGGVPTWVPDANDSNPTAYCDPSHSFGNGPVSLVQNGGGVFDGDYSCPSPHGYLLIAGDGGVFSFGNAVATGSEGGVRLNQPIVGGAVMPDGTGYWEVAADGGIFPFGRACGCGSLGGQHLNQPIVGMAATRTGKGFWLVAADGGIFPFGDAFGYGSTGNIHLNQPIVGMAPTPDGRGYWLVARDGGIFPFGDAFGYGSTGGIRLNKPIVAMSVSRSGNGYLLLASDGGTFTFGDLGSYGSAAGMTLDGPIVGMGVTTSGQGSWMVTSRGTVLTFGDAVGQYYGGEAGRPLNGPILAILPTP